MWYMGLLVLVCTCVYVYKLLAKSSNGELEHNSIDAFIVEDTDNGKSIPVRNTSNRYKRDYITEGCQILILYGTEYGCSEEIAKLLYDRICGLNNDGTGTPIQPRLINARDFHIVDFSREQVCLVVISTSGDGVPPTDARSFYDHILEADVKISHIRFSVLALGDSNYTQFCKTGRVINDRLLELQGSCIVPKHEVDMEDWTMIHRWLDAVVLYLKTADLHADLDYIQHADITEDKYSRHKPFMATLMVKELLTVCEHPEDKETIHCEFDITGSGLTWTSGDALGIYPQNNPAEIERLIKAMKCDGCIKVKKPTWAFHEDNNNDDVSLQLQTVLQKYYDLKCIKSDLLEMLKDHIPNQEEKGKLLSLVQEGFSKDNTQLHGYLCRSDVADVLSDFKSHMLSWQQILDCMKALQPRYYSISSSPKIDSTKVCVTAAVVRYQTASQPRTGVTTTFLQDRLCVGQECPVFMSYNPDFRLPVDSKVPVILIGPGTGIAPFMAYIQERVLEPDSGPTCLYFGCRHRDKDYLYKPQLECWAQQGVLQLRVAFSRDQDKKIYVQSLLDEDRKHIWKLIDEQGASIYICGDATHMAHDVHETLIDLIKGEGHMISKDALTYLQTLEKLGKYQKDVWVV